MVHEVGHGVEGQDDAGEEDAANGDDSNDSCSHGGVRMLKQVPEELLHPRAVRLEVLLHDLLDGRLLPLELLLGVHVLLHAAGGEVGDRDAPVLEVRDKCEGARVRADVEAAYHTKCYISAF